MAISLLNLKYNLFHKNIIFNFGQNHLLHGIFPVDLLPVQGDLAATLPKVHLQPKNN